MNITICNFASQLKHLLVSDGFMYFKFSNLSLGYAEEVIFPKVRYGKMKGKQKTKYQRTRKKAAKEEMWN